jgi:cytochrome P450
MSTAIDIDLMDLGPFIAGREHESFRILREHDPLHWNDEPNGGAGFWSVTRYADVISAISDPVTYINGEGTQILSRKVEGHTPTVHNTDAPRHTELRRVAVPHLRAVKIRDWMDIIDSNVDEILDSITDQDDIEFVHHAAALLPIRVLGEVLGVPREDGHMLYDWTNRVVSDDPEYMTTPDEKERARTEMFAYFKELTEQRRKNPRHDIISILVQAKINGEPLSWEDLAAYYFVLVGAGNETTRNLLTGSVLAFGEHPDQWDRLRADRELLSPAIEELLRYITPIRAMRRTATTDVEWHGKTIKKGDKVVLWFQSANRDPEQFESPDALQIDRAPNLHVGFGWGVHACMGSHLARAEARSFFTKLLDRDLRIVPIAEPDRLHTNQFHAFKRLRVSVASA